MKFSHLLIVSGALMAVSGTAIIDSSLKQRFLGGGSGDTQNVMVSFTHGIDSVIQEINRGNYSSPQEKRSALVSAQQAFSQSNQEPLQSALNSMGVKYESYWISNKMVISN